MVPFRNSTGLVAKHVPRSQYLLDIKTDPTLSSLETYSSSMHETEDNAKEIKFPEGITFQMRARPGSFMGTRKPEKVQILFF